VYYNDIINFRDDDNDDNDEVINTDKSLYGRITKQTIQYRTDLVVRHQLARLTKNKLNSESGTFFFVILLLSMYHVQCISPLIFIIAAVFLRLLK